VTECPWRRGEKLVRPFTRSEVETALKQMTPTKAPRLD